MKKKLLKITLTLLLVALFGTFSVKAAKFNFASTDDFPTVYATMSDGDTLWLTTPGSTAQYTNLTLANNTLTKSLTIMADPNLSSRPILYQATFGAYNLANVYTKFEFVGFEAFYYQPTDIPLDSKYFLDIRSITSVATLKFKNCYIHGYTRDVVRADAGTPVITNLLVDNCLFFDNGRCAASYPVFGIKSATGVTNISFTNTTFINCPSNIITYSNGATALTFLMQNCSVIDCGNFQTRSGASGSYANSAAANLFNFTVAANAASTFTIDKSIISGSFTAADAANFTFNDAVNCAPITTTTTNVIKLNTATATNVNFTNSVILGNTFTSPTTPGGTYTPITANSLTYNLGTLTITTDPTSITGIGDPRWYLNSSAPLSTDATLSALTSSAGTLSPVFAAGTTTYSVVLPAGTITIPTISATVNEAHATTVITQPSSVTGSGTVVVTAQDGTTKITYTVNFSVAATLSTDATLNALSVANNTLSPTFASGTTAYSVVLPFGTTIGNLPAVTYTAAANATAVKTDATALPGTTTINVTAQDGTTTKAYTISFTVAAASTDATLSDLKVGSTTIAGFAAGTLTYNYTLTGGTTVIPQISGTVTESHATTVVTQAATLLGTANIVVTAQDGTTKKTYSVTFKWATGINGISQDQLTYKVSSNTVTIESGSTINNVEVTDINGKLMVEKNIGSTTATVSTDGWSSGIYVFAIQTKDGAVTRKIGIVK